MAAKFCKPFLAEVDKLVNNVYCVTQRGISSTSIRNRARIIDGKKISLDIQAELKCEIDLLLKKGLRHPHLVLARVGDDTASSVYVRNKVNTAEKIGIKSTIHHLPKDVTQTVFLDLIESLNQDEDVDGILVQLPLPDHLEEKLICEAVSPAKDVDSFHTSNVGKFCLDMSTVGPCTPLGVMELIRRYEIKTFGKNAVVCGRSKNVGMPIAMLLHGDGIRPDGELGGFDATTTICHRYTPPEQLRSFLKNADIVVSAAGVPNLITGDMLKAGCVVIDVGINRIRDPETGKRKLVGDCHFESCAEVADYITPVPGGVGPMTVAMLMKNTVLVAKKTLLKT